MKLPPMPETPELNRMRAVRDESATLTRFVDWLDENNMRICVRTEVAPTYRGSPYESITESYERLFARFFGIDLNKVDDERRALLDHQRRVNEQVAPR